MDRIIKYRAVIVLIGFVLITFGIISISKISDNIALNRNINKLNKIIEYKIPEGYEFRSDGGIKCGGRDYIEVKICSENRNAKEYILIWGFGDKDEDIVSENIESYKYDNGYYTFVKMLEVDGETAYYGFRNQYNTIEDEVHFAHSTYEFYIAWEDEISMSDYDREIFNEFIHSINFK